MMSNAVTPGIYLSQKHMDKGVVSPKLFSSFVIKMYRWFPSILNISLPFCSEVSQVYIKMIVNNEFIFIE
jgi:hypothetical protein